MNSSASNSLSDRSGLVRLLGELDGNAVNLADINLAEQLGRLISVTDSISLARSLGQLPQNVKISGSKGPVDKLAVEVQDVVFRVREAMIRTIVESFLAESNGTGIQAPSASLGTRAEALQTYEPYLRFYSMHQAEMAGAVQSLRQRVRNDLATVSPELHRLGELDTILSDSLAVHTSKLLNVIPRLLKQRFTVLLDAYRKKTGDSTQTEPHHWLMPGGWLELFYKDMQELLLAELDLRLQPVLGMLEALNEHNSQISV
jgi:hypothetical protein